MVPIFRGQATSGAALFQWELGGPLPVKSASITRGVYVVLAIYLGERQHSNVSDGVQRQLPERKGSLGPKREKGQVFSFVVILA